MQNKMIIYKKDIRQVYTESWMCQYSDMCVKWCYGAACVIELMQKSRVQTAEARCVKLVVWLGNFFSKKKPHLHFKSIGILGRVVHKVLKCTKSKDLFLQCFVAAFYSDKTVQHLASTIFANVE